MFVIPLAITMTVLACSLPGLPSGITATMEVVIPPLPTLEAQPLPNPPEQPTAETAPAATVEAPVEPTIEIVHAAFPGNPSSTGGYIYDVSSEDTGPEGRAPYGDSYQINRLERPFEQNMTYVPSLDIVTFNLKTDPTWFYISVELVGKDPNDAHGINYGVEIDLDIDGFGDYVVIASPPYSTEWSTNGVKVYKDSNRDTSGLSSTKSDAPITGDGYDELVFDGGTGSDPDLAWVRINAGERATVQFAFKRGLAGGAFMYSVIADAGLKEVGKLDYIDRFTRAEAGSPVRDNTDYPLKALYLVDNTCRNAWGFTATGDESMICPKDRPTPMPGATAIPGCQPPPGGCTDGWWVGEPDCYCTPF
jgi:hypothetical protein